jgi:hypothetical protein
MIEKGPQTREDNLFIFNKLPTLWKCYKRINIEMSLQTTTTTTTTTTKKTVTKSIQQDESQNWRTTFHELK